MSPRWKELEQTFYDEFAGMTNEPVELSELIETRSRMVAELQARFTEIDRDFLLSFKRGKPDWSLFDLHQHGRRTRVTISHTCYSDLFPLL